MTQYERYQLQWMIDHDHSLSELLEEMLATQTNEKGEIEFKDDVVALFNEWEFSHGFGGEVWACEEEWKEYEAQADPPELADALDECDAIITPAMDGFDNAKKMYAKNNEFRNEVAKKFNYYWNKYLEDASDTKFECVVDALDFAYRKWKEEGRVEE